jgi:hypothetical protein
LSRSISCTGWLSQRRSSQEEWASWVERVSVVAGSAIRKIAWNSHERSSKGYTSTSRSVDGEINALRIEFTVWPLVESIPFPSKNSFSRWNPVRDGDRLGLVVLHIALWVLRDLEELLGGGIRGDIIGEIGEAVSNVSSSEEPLNCDLISSIDGHLRRSSRVIPANEVGVVASRSVLHVVWCSIEGVSGGRRNESAVSCHEAELQKNGKSNEGPNHFNWNGMTD